MLMVRDRKLSELARKLQTTGCGGEVGDWGDAAPALAVVSHPASQPPRPSLEKAKLKFAFVI
jgi:hypothetical protein